MLEFLENIRIGKKMVEFLEKKLQLVNKSTKGGCIRHHQMISFQKIYGLYGLKHHTMEINGDVTMETNERTNEQTIKWK